MGCFRNFYVERCPHWLPACRDTLWHCSAGRRSLMQGTRASRVPRQNLAAQALKWLFMCQKSQQHIELVICYCPCLVSLLQHGRQITSAASLSSEGNFDVGSRSSQTSNLAAAVDTDLRRCASRTQGQLIGQDQARQSTTLCRRSQKSWR